MSHQFLISSSQKILHIQTDTHEVMKDATKHTSTLAQLAAFTFDSHKALKCIAGTNLEIIHTSRA